MKSAVSDGYEEAVEEFKKHPLVGCTTVFDMARIVSGYNPNEEVEGENRERYDDYVKRIMKCPFFHLKKNEIEYFHRKDKSWSAAIKEIANLFTGVTEGDRENITQSIINLANAATSNRNTRQGKSLFSVSTLSSDDHMVEVYIFSTSISLIETKKKGSDSKQTDLDISKIDLAFAVDMWPYHAEAVYKKHLELIDDWLDDNNTRPGPEPTNLCIGGYKALP